MSPEVEAAFERAKARWSRFLLLKPPVATDATEIAMIDLSTRQVSVNLANLERHDLGGSLEAVLAHEIGHHVRYPGTLAVDARLRVLERELVPLDGYSFINTFTDLMINERLGADLSEPLAAVYRAFAGRPAFHEKGWRRDPSFCFYLLVYEALWRLPAGDLLGAVHGEFARRFPRASSDAAVLSQDLFRVGPNLYTQFILFASMMLRYLEPLDDEKLEGAGPYACRHGEPGPDDWAAALRPDAAEKAAIERALREGWLSAAQAERLEGEDALARRLAGVPGHGGADATLVGETMAAWYRREAERYVFRPPAQRLLGEAVVPTTTRPWEPGENVRDIDWLTTLLERGPVLGPAAPLEREKVAEREGLEVSLWRPRMEIYLDVSGSMPDPRSTVNAMTLAAQILVAGTVRAGGAVRALVYSHAEVRYWQWCRSEAEMSRFLMHYIGGGTEFPFSVLAESIAECGRAQPIRVVISDSDFDANYEKTTGAKATFRDAARRSAALVLLLHGPAPERVSTYRAEGAAVVAVKSMDDFPAMARDLSFALFPEGGGG